jgi:hypothetical protein
MFLTPQRGRRDGDSGDPSRRHWSRGGCRGSVAIKSTKPSRLAFRPWNAWPCPSYVSAVVSFYVCDSAEGCHSGSVAALLLSELNAPRNEGVLTKFPQWPVARSRCRSLHNSALVRAAPQPLLAAGRPVQRWRGLPSETARKLSERQMT